MLKNMKVKMSLIMGFGVTVLVSIIIVIVSLVIMNVQSSSYQGIIDTEVRASALVRTCRLQVNMTARYLRDVALDPEGESGQQSATKTTESLSPLTDYISELRSLNVLGNTTLIDDYIGAVQLWGEAVPGIMNTALGGDHEEAIRMLQEECTPALTKVDEAAGALQTAITAEQDGIVKRQENMVTISIVAIIAALVLGTILVMLLELRIIRSITGPVEEVRTALIGYSEGKLDIPVHFESKNELGDMCHALRTSQSVLSDVINDTNRLLEAMADGDFDVRTRAEQSYVGALSGLLKSISGINRSLSAALTQIQSSADQVKYAVIIVSTLPILCVYPFVQKYFEKGVMIGAVKG